MLRSGQSTFLQCIQKPLWVVMFLEWSWMSLSCATLCEYILASVCESFPLAIREKTRLGLGLGRKRCLLQIALLVLGQPKQAALSPGSHPKVEQSSVSYSGSPFPLAPVL